MQLGDGDGILYLFDAAGRSLKGAETTIDGLKGQITALTTANAEVVTQLSVARERVAELEAEISRLKEPQTGEPSGVPSPETSAALSVTS